MGNEPILSYIPQTNTLTDLSNRENRAFNPRFANDYARLVNGTPVLFPDGVPDDFNSDGFADFYPTLYPGAFSPTGNPYTTSLVNMPVSYGSISLVLGSAPTPFDVLAFPFAYPNSFSLPAVTASSAGRTHPPGGPDRHRQHPQPRSAAHRR